MNPHLQLFWQIRHQSQAEGVAAALRTARAAVDDGRLAPTEVAELFLALRRNDWHRVIPQEAATTAPDAHGAQVAA